MIEADLLISGATVATMNAAREVIADGAIAIAADRIVAVGKREDVEREVRAARTLTANRYVASPGFVDAHIHITGDPLTRGFPRGAPEESWNDKLQRWVIPIFKAHTAQDEAISAQCAALAMIARGTTCFVEAGTISHLDAVGEALEATGIRGRIGDWVEGRAWDPAADAAEVAGAAIAILEREVERWPDRGGAARIAAWPILVGHTTNPDEVWSAAHALAHEHGLRVSAHMSPRAGDGEAFMARYQRRPLEHLADIGVLDDHVVLTHLAHLSQGEFDLLVQAGAGPILCPHAAVQGGFGLAAIGRHPEMLAAGLPLMVGTDGIAADVLSSARLAASLFRDMRGDQDLVGAPAVLEMATLNPARALGLDHLIGSLEVGKKADIVLHDAWTPEWGAMFDVVEQLAFSAPPSGVRHVWIDGRQVLADGRATWTDEDALLARGREAGRAVIARTGLPGRSPWPMI